MQNLVEWLEQRHRYYAFIKIAPPGDGLTSKIFNAETDVSTYNKILINTVKNWGPQGTVLDPYVGHNIEEFILADGHHLNPVGERLVFETVNNWIWSVAPAFAEEARKNL